LSGILAGRDGGWPLHALEHGLSAWTDASHGRGLAMLLPRVMAFDAQVIPEKILGFNQRVFGVPSTISDPWNALEQGLVRFMKEVDAWTDLEDVAAGMPLEELSMKIIDHALETSAVLKRGEEPYLENCRRIDRASGLAILKACERKP
jgi:alcohol dehydrogenase YqhD (iron-dependent ADH family)